MVERVDSFLSAAVPFRLVDGGNGDRKGTPVREERRPSRASSLIKAAHQNVQTAIPKPRAIRKEPSESNLS